MREIMRTNDPVVLSLAEALLREAGLQPMIADSSMSVMEGSVGILPRRVLVADNSYAEARSILTDRELGPWLLDP